MTRIKRLVDFFLAVLLTVPSYLLGKLCYGGKHIWLVGERPGQAQDNGYHFFKYMCQNHPEQRVYYVIKKDSPQRPRVEALGSVLDYGSPKHWLMYFGCEAVVSAHILSLLPCDNWRYRRLAAKLKQKSKKTVFLQHGVTSADIKSLYKEKTQVDLFTCGAKPECDYVQKQFHYRNNEVVYTGFARYDALHDFTVKKQILIMPTWRTWLLKENDLPNSEYITEWNRVISDRSLIQAAADKGYRIVFYPHNQMQFARDLFRSVDDNLVIADEEHYDVQTLLKESALLITDFSSVFFDFAYMRKPVLFFHFDKERHAAEHYQKGYFDYERDGFGKVAYTAPELIENVKEMLQTQVVLSEEYSRRIDRFFPLYDEHNCERIYEAICKMLQKTVE